MKLIMYTADCVGNGKNTYYPHRTEVTDADSFRAAIAHDHVCAEYKDNYRGNANFIEASCLVLDIDNDHTDLPEEFITIDALLQAYLLPVRSVYRSGKLCVREAVHLLLLSLLRQQRAGCGAADLRRGLAESGLE